MRITPNIPTFQVGRLFYSGQLVKYRKQIKNVVTTYHLRCKTDIQLSAFNPIWFENTTPKQWLGYTNIDFEVMPLDSIVLKQGVVLNESYGYLTRNEAVHTLPETQRLACTDVLFVNGLHRNYLINMYPKVNVRHDEAKYQFPSITRFHNVYVENVEEDVILEFYNVEAMFNLVNSTLSYYIVQFSNTTVVNATYTSGNWSGYILPNAQGVTTRIRLFNDNGQFKAQML